MKQFLKLFIICALILLMVPVAFATNGDNLISIGPIARTMGGVGIAFPQDAISAIFSNPASMCFSPYCPSSEFNFASTFLTPDVKAEVTLGNMTISAHSDDKTYLIPAIGVSVPLNNKLPFWRFGLAAYGVTGIGVDYRDSAIDQPRFFDLSNNFGLPPGSLTAPLVEGEYVQFQIMKFAPCIAFQPYKNFSVGLAAHVDYSSLDISGGQSFDYGFGFQLGALYKVTDQIHIGATYISPQKLDYDNIIDIDNDGLSDTLSLESPQVVGIGIAYETIDRKFLIEADAKWLNWRDAQGYDDLDWDNQYVFVFGLQYKPMDKLALRTGYNYGKNPVSEHNGFTGSDMTTIQGKTLPTYYYETIRIIGFPAIIEHHFNIGVGYEFSDKFALNVGYAHAFENTIKESGTAIDGATPVILKSSAKGDTFEFGLTLRF